MSSWHEFFRIKRLCEKEFFFVLKNTRTVSISISDEYFDSENIPEHDRVLLQTFGFTYDNDLNRYVAVFLTYLANLSPEHQKVWAVKQVNGDIMLHPDCYASSILGSWGTKMSIFEAFVQNFKQSL